jgi:hypothetical protein
MSHQWGAMDRSQLTQSKNPTFPTVSVRIHRRITRQHPRLHQNPHHKNSTPNISTHIKQWVYLVFKENIQIATLLKRGNKNVDIKFSAHEQAKIQHSQQCQSVFTVESQDNIPDCTKTHIIKTALPISLPGVKETPT